VIKIGADPGDTVKAGQPLLWLDSPDFSAALADLKKARNDMRLKQLAYDRAKILFEGEVLAKKDIETSETDLNQSQAEFQRAKSRFANLNPTDEEGNKYLLRAPLEGVVADRQVNPGAEVRPDAPNPLFIITDPAHLWVILDLPERDLAKVKTGQSVVVEVDAYPGQQFPAKVIRLGSVLDPGTRRIQVRCTLPNPDKLLKPEMYARVTPIADTQRQMVKIPNSALLSEGLYTHVFVEKTPGTLEKRRIALGLQGHESSYVKEGLQEGDRIVTSGVLLLNSELVVEEEHAK
jgi:cobalt-zinc-cadmium efflux system membrane fusion protein